MPKEVAKKISERVLGPEQMLVLVAYGSEKTVDDISRLRVGKAAFFKVRQAFNAFKFGSFKLYDSDGNAVGPVSPNTGKDYQRLYRDTSGNDIFENDEHWMLYHYSLAVQQPTIRIYPSIPRSELMGALTYAVSGEPDPTTPDNYGYVVGREMDFDDPPADLENVGWRTGDTGTKSDIEYGFYNEDNTKKVDPILNVKGRAYTVEPITEKGRQKSLLLGKEPRTIVSIGPIHKAVGVDWPDKWDSVGAVMEIEEPVRGGGA